ncbi:MAG TPA: L-seryl-tRNA(Sec) selenium transferase, partial [Pseudoxanthomonas sp.]
DPDRLEQRLTTLRLLARPAEEIAAAAQRLLPAFQRAFGARATVSAERCASQIGSGAQPEARLASVGFRIQTGAAKRGGLDRLAKRLRALPHPVLGRVADDALWLDLRCLDDKDEAVFLAQLRDLRP